MPKIEPQSTADLILGMYEEPDFNAELFEASVTAGTDISNHLTQPLPAGYKLMLTGSIESGKYSLSVVDVEGQYLVLQIESKSVENRRDQLTNLLIWRTAMFKYQQATSGLIAAILYEVILHRDIEMHLAQTTTYMGVRLWNQLIGELLDKGAMVLLEERESVEPFFINSQREFINLHHRIWREDDAGLDIKICIRYGRDD